MKYVDVWSTVALQERQVRSIEKLWKLKLIERSPKLILHVAYYRVINRMLKSLLKMKVKLHASSLRKRKESQPTYSRERVIPLDLMLYASFVPYGLRWTGMK